MEQTNTNTDSGIIFLDPTKSITLYYPKDEAFVYSEQDANLYMQTFNPAVLKLKGNQMPIEYVAAPISIEMLEVLEDRLSRDISFFLSSVIKIIGPDFVIESKRNNKQFPEQIESWYDSVKENIDLSAMRFIGKLAREYNGLADKKKAKLRLLPGLVLPNSGEK